MSGTPSVFDRPLDSDINDVAEGLVILVDGNTAPRAISSGQYLFIKNHSTLATGGYHATAAIASGASVSSSNTAADTDGIVNALNSKVTALNSKITSLVAFERHTATFGQCSPNTDYVQSIDVSKSGYTPIGIISYTILGTYGTHFHVSQIDIVNYTNATIRIRANSSTTFTTDSTKVEILVLYRKS